MGAIQTRHTTEGTKALRHVTLIAMVDKASATAQVDKNGRLYLPASTRKALGIHQEPATLDLDVTVLERLGDGDE